MNYCMLIKVSLRHEREFFWSGYFFNGALNTGLQETHTDLQICKETYQ